MDTSPVAPAPLSLEPELQDMGYFIKFAILTN